MEDEIVGAVDAALLELAVALDIALEEEVLIEEEEDDGLELEPDDGGDDAEGDGVA